jgi:hypothetical protein
MPKIRTLLWLYCALGAVASTSSSAAGTMTACRLNPAVDREKPYFRKVGENFNMTLKLQGQCRIDERTIHLWGNGSLITTFDSKTDYHRGDRHIISPSDGYISVTIKDVQKTDTLCFV